MNRIVARESKDPEARDGAKSKELLQCGNRRLGEAGQKKSDLGSRGSAVSMVMLGGGNWKSEES